MSMPRKIRCTVETITDHGGRVYTLELKPEGLVPAFRPGQFLHLTVDEYDAAGFWPESRVFSIASSPRERSRIRICYSVKGRYTTKMEQTLKVGGEVWVKMPYGDFVIDQGSDAILLAGGTGISAFTAFIEALEPGNPRKVWLVYGARDPGLLLFRDMLLEQSRRVASFHLLFFTEVADGDFTGGMAALPKPPQCLAGRIDLNSVFRPLTQDARSLASENRSPSSAICPPTSLFYLAGPPVMLDTLSAGLRSRGIPPEQIRTDAWE